ncbi:MAG: DUF2059 domain-containing protein [Caulobacter sp.]
MKRAAAAFAALLFVAGFAGQAAAAPSQRNLELAHRYIEAIGMKKNFAPMLDNMMGALLEQQMASFEGDSETRALVLKAMRESLSETMEEGMLARLMGALEPVMAEQFTEQELQAMVDFYESPVGRSITAKMPEFGTTSGAAVAKVMPEMQAELIRRLREKLAGLNLKSK